MPLFIQSGPAGAGVVPVMTFREILHLRLRPWFARRRRRYRVSAAAALDPNPARLGVGGAATGGDCDATLGCRPLEPTTLV